MLITTERAWNASKSCSKQPDVAVEPKLGLWVETGLLSEGSRTTRRFRYKARCHAPRVSRAESGFKIDPPDATLASTLKRPSSLVQAGSINRACSDMCAMHKRLPVQVAFRPVYILGFPEIIEA